MNQFIPKWAAESRVFSKSVDFEVTGWDSLKPYRIGLQRGVIHIEKATAGMNTHSVSELEMALQMLDYNRLDVVVVPKLPGLKGLKNAGLTDIKMLSPPLQRDSLYHFLHIKHAALVAPLTEELKQMQESGELEKSRAEAEKAIFESHFE